MNKDLKQLKADFSVSSASRFKNRTSSIPNVAKTQYPYQAFSKVDKSHSVLPASLKKNDE